MSAEPKLTADVRNGTSVTPSAESVVVRHGHQDGEIPDYHQAVWMGESVLRDRRGRPHQHGWTRFAVVVCNNPGCKYEALVNAEVVATAALTDGGGCA